MDPDKYLKYCSYGKHMTTNNTVGTGITIGGGEWLYLPGAGCASCNKELRVAISDFAVSFQTHPKLEKVAIAPLQPPKEDTMVPMTLTILKEPLLGGVTKKRRARSEYSNGRAKQRERTTQRARDSWESMERTSKKVVKGIGKYM